MTDWTQLVTGDALDEAVKERRKTTIKETKIKPAEVAGREADGWTVVKEYKDGTFAMEKSKRFYDVFENEVWMVLYKMGFSIMNSRHDMKFDLNGNTKKVDVVAIDDETCIFVECKATETFEKKMSFKKELESINGYYGDLKEAIKAKYGARKFKYIFATKNYLLSQDDKNRIDSFKLNYFDYDTVRYYSDLTDHLGSAARYQLLGQLFQNEKIPNMSSEIPAMRGKMGGVEYYTFLIEPEKLLKLGYVLHRNKANHLMMPTYQRIIKKSRLNDIRKFVNGGGYFPNSLIISIDTHGKPLRFDQVGKGSSSTKIGTLYLPQEYHSMYIIDGQHRLYGYSDSDFANKDVVPVVAFENLPSERQVEMFMEINENQKAVPKALRNTLNIDLLWESTDPKKRKEALLLRIAEGLGEETGSPLYGRIRTGEDSTTDIRVITTDYIKDALKQSAFFNEYDKTGIKTVGTMDKNDNDMTFPIIRDYIIKCLNVIAELCSEEWDAGSEGFLTINNTAYALIRIIDDITNIQLKKSGISVVNDVDEIFEKCEPMLIDLADAISKLPQETKTKIKKAKGGSAKKDSWRPLQVALHEKNPDFINDELKTYIEDYCTDNNPEANGYVCALEDYLKEQFKTAMVSDDNWIYDRVPDGVATGIVQEKAKKNHKLAKEGLPEVDEWEFISFDELHKISVFKSNWTDFAQDILSRPGQKNTKASIAWLANLAKYKNKVRMGNTLTRMEFNELEGIYHDFIVESDDDSPDVLIEVHDGNN